MQHTCASLLLRSCSRCLSLSLSCLAFSASLMAGGTERGQCKHAMCHDNENVVTMIVTIPGLADCGGWERAGGVAEGGAGLAWTGADTGAELDIGGCDNMARRA